MELGDKIKNLRKKAGITQEKLAAELGVTPQTISKYENNVCAPDIGMLPKLSVFFGVSIDELFDMTVEQKLNRIENQLDYEEVLPEEVFLENLAFLQEQLENYEDTGKIYSLLAHLYHHRMTSDGKKVSEYAKKSMRLKPDVKDAQWLLQKSEGAAITDWNAGNHRKTIAFYKEQVKLFPEIARNYLELMDNLLLDHRVAEAKEYLEKYSSLPKKSEFQVYVYRARIALGEYRKEEAFSVLAEMEKAFSDNPGVLFEMAGFFAEDCQYEKAIAYFEKAYELDEKPRYSDALYGIAMIWEILGDYEKADHTCERILQNLAEEWHITEGAPVAEVLNLQKSFRN